ncbi:MAG: glycosyltransferase [Acidobacteriaceae bacterium]|nr:glycosyltransferase [Acidobacteriaceae bacterium]MBV9307658.1 glycosyltransferase [Acidobacteriaceae bacterium]
MKILWVKTDFLHPTTRGGQIRTLEMLRELHKRHEVHYIAFDDPLNPEGLKRSSEYASHSYPVPHKVIPKNSPAFALQLFGGLGSTIPVAGMRYRSTAMRDTIAKVVSAHDFDAKVCDFLFPSLNIADLRTWTLFQHNVESVIWERHAKSGRTAAHRAYFKLQAKRMLQWERDVCRAVAQVVAVSETDEQLMRSRFGIERVSSVPTGVDVDYFERPSSSSILYDLVFIGSMDWMPNVDGMRWFLSDVFPLIRQERPDCRLAIVGRNPPQALLDAAKDPQITVTGTVPDVRPFLWQSALSIVPLRVGGGTRLKIFEAMAAGTPVVSTTIGAEGLPVRHGETVQIADTAQQFAAECLKGLAAPHYSRKIAQQGRKLVVDHYSWEQVTKGFERTLFAPKPEHIRA